MLASGNAASGKDREPNLESNLLKSAIAGLALPRTKYLTHSRIMTALPSKIALRRMLQNYIGRLDDTIVELMASDKDIPMSCRFCEDFIIVWHDRQQVFSPSTYTLLRQFFKAPNMMLSKEDVRQDVLFDTEAREGSLRQCVSAARKELRRAQFPYRIETIIRKGYRLVPAEGEEFSGQMEECLL